MDLASGSNPNDIVIGDLNGDGRPDVVFCNQYGNTIYILPKSHTLSPAPPTRRRRWLAPRRPPASLPGGRLKSNSPVDAIHGLVATPVGNLGYTSGEVHGLAFVFDGSTSYIPFPASSNLDIGSQGVRHHHRNLGQTQLCRQHGHARCRMGLSLHRRPSSSG